MNKGELLTLFRNLNQLGELNGVKFTYAVVKNINLLKPELESLEKAMEAPDRFKKFEDERIKLVEKYAEKDDKGQSKKEKGANGIEQYVMGVDKKKFEKEFEALKLTHDEALKARERQIEEYTKLLATEAEVKLYKIKLEDVPKEITAKQMAGLYELILDEK